jgi:hypothetical protein
MPSKIGHCRRLEEKDDGSGSSLQRSQTRVPRLGQAGIRISVMAIQNNRISYWTTCSYIGSYEPGVILGHSNASCDLIGVKNGMRIPHSTNQKLIRITLKKRTGWRRIVVTLKFLQDSFESSMYLEIATWVTSWLMVIGSISPSRRSHPVLSRHHPSHLHSVRIWNHSLKSQVTTPDESGMHIYLMLHSKVFWRPYSSVGMTPS